MHIAPQASHFVIGFNVAIPACSLVITRRISQITRLRSIIEKRQVRLFLLVLMVNTTHIEVQRQREDIIDIVICIGIPIFLMTDCRYFPVATSYLNLLKVHAILSATDYIVQCSRYQILEEYGCAESSIASGVEIMLQELWFVGLPLIAVLFYFRESILGLLRLQLGTDGGLQQ